eukprot:gb/GFBE01073249.1/.p1 GENE.gb/GFBE01073249.1/~~gb/GFBE01073249.1/.p1  ORF type:complete len:660 (+),score=121.15 gb/GFBE01073249.1/:1-1980(+)
MDVRPSGMNFLPGSQTARTLLCQKLIQTLGEGHGQANTSGGVGLPISEASLQQWKRQLDDSLRRQKDDMLRHFDKSLGELEKRLQQQRVMPFALPFNQGRSSPSGSPKNKDRKCFAAAGSDSMPDGTDERCGGGSTEGHDRQDSQEGMEVIAKDSTLPRIAGSVQESDHDAYEKALQEAKARRLEEIKTRGRPSVMKAMNPMPRSAQEWMQRLVRDWRFEIFWGLAIIINSAGLGIQVHYSAQHFDEPTPVAFTVIQLFWTGMFVTELVIRVIASGKDYFKDEEDWMWNFCDLGIVLLSVLEAVLTIIFWDADSAALGDGAPVQVALNMRTLRVIRIVRIVRAVRIVRLIKFIRALRTLVSSIASTLRSLVWAMLLLYMIIYVFSVLFTDVVTGYRIDELENISDEEMDFLTHRFGGMDATIITLFHCVSGGMDWNEASDLMFRIGAAWGLLLLAYVSFCTFAVLNVMTGVFCEAAIQAARADEQSVIQDQFLVRKRFTQRVNQLFDILAGKKSGDKRSELTVIDIQEAFEDEKMAALFMSLDVDVHDIWSLWKLLDVDGSGAVDADEFFYGLMRLRGPAKTVDVAKLLQDSSQLRSRMTRMEELQGVSAHTVREIWQLLSDLAGDTTSTAAAAGDLPQTSEPPRDGQSIPLPGTLELS